MALTKLELQKRKEQNISNFKRLVLFLLLSAIGFGLLMIGKLPHMKLFYFLEIEFSDLITIVTYFLFGTFASICSVLIRYGIQVAIYLPQLMSTGFPIEELNSIISSIVLLIILSLVDHASQFFKQKAGHRFIGYSFIVLFVTIIMFTLEYAFIVPTIINDNHFITKFVMSLSGEEMHNLRPDILVFKNYTTSLLLMAVFYIVLYSINCLIYEIVFKDFLFKYMEKNTINIKEAFRNNGKSKILKYTQNLKSVPQFFMGRKNRGPIKDSKDKNTFPKERIEYKYILRLNENNQHKVIVLTSNRETSTLIKDYMKTFYPKTPYHIVDYKKGEETYTNPSTDYVPLEIYRQINKCDKLITRPINVDITILKNA